MSTYPPGFDGPGTYFQCPLCPEVIKEAEIPPMDDLKVVPREGEDALAALTRARLEQHYAAQDAVVTMHLNMSHTAAQAVRAFGPARLALAEIHKGITVEGMTLEQIDEACHRGLGFDE